MAARRLANMTRRNGVYYVRGCIPKILHSRAQIRELRVSLRTKDVGAARTRLQPIAPAFDSLCRHLCRVQFTDAPDQDSVAAAQSFGRELLRNAAPPSSFGGANADHEYDRTLSTLVPSGAAGYLPKSRPVRFCLMAPPRDRIYLSAAAASVPVCRIFYGIDRLTGSIVCSGAGPPTTGNDQQSCRG